MNDHTRAMKITSWRSLLLGISPTRRPRSLLQPDRRAIDLGEIGPGEIEFLLGEGSWRDRRPPRNGQVTLNDLEC